MLRWWFWIPGSLCIGRNLKRHAKPRTNVTDFNPLVKHSDDTPVNYHANGKIRMFNGKNLQKVQVHPFCTVLVVERYNIQSTQAFKKSSPLMRQGFALFSPIAGTFFAVLFDHFFDRSWHVNHVMSFSIFGTENPSNFQPRMVITPALMCLEVVRSYGIASPLDAPSEGRKDGWYSANNLLIDRESLILGQIWAFT